MHGSLVVLILLVLAFPFAIAGYGIWDLRNEQRYANPPPAVLPKTFRSDRLLILPWFALASFFLTLSLLLLAIGYLDGPWDRGLGNIMIGLLLLGPSAWYSWQHGYRMVRPDTLTLSEQGIAYRSLGGVRRWPWQELSGADNESIGYRDVFAPDLYLVLEGGYTENLGNLWSGPFGMPAAQYLARILRATIAARRDQPMTAQLSG